MNRSSCFIVGAETVEYLQHLMYEADLEAYKNQKERKRSMKNNWIYIGIFLDEKSKKLLKKLYPPPADFWTEYYDHMTVVFNDNTMIAKAVKSVNENNIGKKFKLKLVGPGISEKAYAVQVELPKGVVSANKITHITMGVAPIDGANAVDSNYITNWSKVYDNVYLTGEMKVYVPLTNGALMNTKVDEANIY